MGGALRAPVRVLARLRRRAGAAVPGLRPLRERLRPDPVPGLREEYLLAFSCKTRELCPSCAARRAAATAVVAGEEVLEEVGHAQWVFVMPKMLRPYFLHHRELLGGLARAAWETVRELMAAAVGAPHRDVPGTALCRNDHPAPRRASHNADAGHSTGSAPHLVVPARMEAAGASSAWSQTFRLPYERPR